MAELQWTTQTPEEMFRKIQRRIKDKKLAVLSLLAMYYAPQVQAWMKQNAPWTDRTGNARQSLHTWVETGRGSVILWLAHGVDYGKWLELRWAGRYSVIGPAIDHFTPLVMDDVRGVLGGK